jgi:hypothetical protein
MEIKTYKIKNKAKHKMSIFMNSSNQKIEPEDYKAALCAMIESSISEQQLADNIVQEVSINGEITAHLAFGSITGLISEDEISTYLLRLEAIKALKDNDLIPQKPFVDIPDNKAGRKFLKKLIGDI